MELMFGIMSKKVFARIGFADVIVPVEKEFEPITTIPDQFFVCYEDEDGNECNEDGSPINE